MDQVDLLFIDATEAVTAVWDGLLSYLDESWPGVTEGLIEGWDNLVSGVTAGIEWLGEKWDTFTTNLRSAWNAVVDFLREKWEEFYGPMRTGLEAVGRLLAMTPAGLAITGAIAVGSALGTEGAALGANIGAASVRNAPGFEAQRDEVRGRVRQPRGNAAAEEVADLAFWQQFEADRRAFEAEMRGLSRRQESGIEDAVRSTRVRPEAAEQGSAKAFEIIAKAEDVAQQQLAEARRHTSVLEDIRRRVGNGPQVGAANFGA
jgi:hypothetical protein